MSHSKGDLFVAFFRMRDVPTYLHWGLLFFDSSYNDMTLIHATGGNSTGWTVEARRHFPALQKRSTLRLVHIGRVRDAARCIGKLYVEVPLANGNPNFNCKTWVMRAIMHLHEWNKIEVKDGGFSQLQHALEQLAASAISRSAPFDIHTVAHCIIPREPL